MAKVGDGRRGGGGEMKKRDGDNEGGGMVKEKACAGTVNDGT